MPNSDYDIVVVGGGHAGVEAALAAVRMGRSAAIVTMDTAKLALMSCNPAIGGIGKSQLVKELDALGGLMGMAIDATGIQFRRLNLSRGPAVWSTRAQADRNAYNRFVVDYCKSQSNLDLIEGTAAEILVKSGRVTGIITEDGGKISCGALIIATGTFLGGLIHIGEKQVRAGRFGESAAHQLSRSFLSLGFEVGRLKTGTPPRLDGDSIDFSRCEEQPGEEPPPLFSFKSAPRSFEQASCHLTRTTEATKHLIERNFGRSAIFSGQIRSTGPRYCPSIEDKFHRFADKPHHQLFLEPEGNGTNEIYPNGFSTALPEEIQAEAIRTVIGLEEAVITRPGYAVEYDYCPAYQISASLETRSIKGLFLAGQINGTSGYEEAAAQGLVAGVNAACYLTDISPLILDRSEAYIGVMIDDLVTRSTTEPYRMFTSRAEYRLALREDNARDRLFPHAARLGLVEPEELQHFEQLEKDTVAQIETFRKTRLAISDLGKLGGRFQKGNHVTAAHLLKQPGLGAEEILPLIENLGRPLGSNGEAVSRASIRIRYEGYIDKQAREIKKYKQMEQTAIPESFDYTRVKGLKEEAREKFVRFRPASLGQAGRIEGITAGDLAVLSIFVKRFRSQA